MKAVQKKTYVIPVRYADIEGIRGGEIYLTVKNPAYIDPRLVSGEIALYIRSERFRLMTVYRAVPPSYVATIPPNVDIEKLIRNLLVILPDSKVVVTDDTIEIQPPPAFFDSLDEARQYIMHVTAETEHKLDEAAEIYGVKFERHEKAEIYVETEKLSEDDDII